MENNQPEWPSRQVLLDLSAGCNSSFIAPTPPYYNSYYQGPSQSQVPYYHPPHPYSVTDQSVSSNQGFQCEPSSEYQLNYQTNVESVKRHDLTPNVTDTPPSINNTLSNISNPLVSPKLNISSEPSFEHQLLNKEANKDAEKIPDSRNNDAGSSKYTLPLLEFLEDCSDRKQILSSYKLNKQSLTNKTSKELVRVIIAREKDEVLKRLIPGQVLQSWEIPKDRLIHLSKEIEKTFAGTAAASYYLPFCIEEGKRLAASGKLIDHFNYVKRLMRQSGILQGTKNKNDSENVTHPIIALDSQNDDLQFLINHSEPFSKVKDAFQRTSEVRKQMLCVKNLTVFDYMLSVKSLRFDQQGQELIHLDFQCRYKDQQSKLKDKWPKLRDYFISLLKGTKSIAKDDEQHILILPTLKSETQDVLIFYLLHYFTTIDRKKRKRKNSFDENEENIRKLSTEKKRSSYLLHVEDATELEGTLERLRTNLKAKKLRLQPLTVIVGPLLDVQGIYVIVDDMKYSVKTIIDAIDLNFKIFFVFDCAYPSSSASTWMFIQTVIYEIRKPGERLTVQHRVLEGEIKHLLR